MSQSVHKANLALGVGICTKIVGMITKRSILALLNAGETQKYQNI